MKKITILFILFTSILLTACTSPSGNTTLESDEIKIGAILHLTNNDYANVGQEMMKGIELAVENQNTKIKIIYEDDHNNPLQALTAAKKLVEVDNVKAVIVSTYGEAMAIGPFFEEKKIPLIVLWDSNKALDDIGDYVFSVGSWTESAGTRIADFAYTDLKVRKIAVISHQTEFSQAITNFFKQRFIKLGGSITSSDSVPPDTTDFRTAILKAKNKDPDAIFAPIDRLLGTFFKQMNQSGYNGFVLSSDAVTQDAIDNADGGAEGIYYTTFKAPITADNLKEQYKKKYNKEPDLLVYNGFAYDAMLALFKAIELSNNNAKSIQTNLYTIKDLPGSLGNISFNKFGSAPKYEGVFQVKNGKEVFVKK